MEAGRLAASRERETDTAAREERVAPGTEAGSGRGLACAREFEAGSGFGDDADAVDCIDGDGRLRSGLLGTCEDGGVTPPLPVGVNRAAAVFG